MCSSVLGEASLFIGEETVMNTGSLVLLRKQGKVTEVSVVKGLNHAFLGQEIMSFRKKTTLEYKLK